MHEPLPHSVECWSNIWWRNEMNLCRAVMLEYLAYTLHPCIVLLLQTEPLPVPAWFAAPWRAARRAQDMPPSPSRPVWTQIPGPNGYVDDNSTTLCVPIVSQFFARTTSTLANQFVFWRRLFGLLILRTNMLFPPHLSISSALSWMYTNKY